MALGLIGGSIAAGLGEAGNKWIALEEKQRAEDAAQENKLETISFANREAQAAKDKDLARLKAEKAERFKAFRSEAQAWRAENPTADIADFVAHFATTEHADLLAPTLEAAKYKDARAEKEAMTELRRLQGEESKARTEYTLGAKSEAERMRAEAAKTRAETGGKGLGGGKPAGLSEKDYENARGDVLKRNVLTNLDDRPDPLANAALAENLDKFYQATHNMAQAERYAVDATQAGAEFAQEQAAKAGGKYSRAQYSAWLDQGAQKYINALAERRKPKSAGATGSWGAEAQPTKKGLIGGD